MNRRRLVPSPLLLLGALAALAISSCATPEPVVEMAEPVEIETPVDPGWSREAMFLILEVELPEPFIKLVDLARLRVGMTKEEVLAVFPDPVRIQIRGSDDVWQYNFAELIFRNGRLRDWFNLP